MQTPPPKRSCCGKRCKDMAKKGTWFCIHVVYWLKHATDILLWLQEINEKSSINVFAAMWKTFQLFGKWGLLITTGKCQSFKKILKKKKESSNLFHEKRLDKTSLIPQKSMVIYIITRHTLFTGIPPFKYVAHFPVRFTFLSISTSPMVWEVHYTRMRSL